MPELRLGLNDKILFESTGSKLCLCVVDYNAIYYVIIIKDNVFNTPTLPSQKVIPFRRNKQINEKESLANNLENISTLNFNPLLEPEHSPRYAGGISKCSFISMVRPTIHTNLS